MKQCKGKKSNTNKINIISIYLNICSECKYLVFVFAILLCNICAMAWARRARSMVLPVCNQRSTTTTRAITRAGNLGSTNGLIQHEELQFSLLLNLH